MNLWLQKMCTDNDRLCQMVRVSPFIIPLLFWQKNMKKKGIDEEEQEGRETSEAQEEAVNQLIVHYNTVSMIHVSAVFVLVS